MKFFIAVVLLAVAAYVSADKEVSAVKCDELERFKVKHQWSEAFGHGHHRLEFGVNLWKSILHDHPEIKELFKEVRGDNIYSAEFEAHSQRVLSGLDMTISLLDDDDAFNAQLAHLKSQHATRHVTAEHFVWFRNHLIEVLPDYLGTHVDFDAWKDCIDLIADGIHE